VQWVVNAYLLAIAALVAVGGRLSDVLGHVRIFLIGVVIFAVASALVGLAQGDAWVIMARSIQGVGAALMIPPSAAIVINSFPLAERGRAMGVYAGVSMIFLSLGPLVGGLFTEWTWRAVFWINVPLAIATIFLTLRAKPPSGRLQGQRIDVAGLGTLVPGLVAVVLALMQSATWGWSDPKTWGLLAGGMALLVVFVLVELRVRQPLVELRLFRGRNFSGDNTVLFCIQFALTGLTVFGAIFVQDILGFSAIEAGLSLLALTLPLLIVAPRSGAIYDRIGPRLLVGVGCALVAASFFWLGATADKLSYPWMVPAYVVMGIGIGLVMGPANTDAMNGAPQDLRGVASGVVQTVRQVGGTVGLAIMGMVVTTVQHSRLDSLLSGLGVSSDQIPRIESLLSQAPGEQQVAAQALPGVQRAQLVGVVREATTSGITWAYYVAGIATALACVAAFALLRHVKYAEDQAGASAVAVG
jgi:EmrB/QacA subfamily drug resistance transporter